MKMYKYILGYTNMDYKKAWDRYSQTRNPADKPSGKGVTPYVVVTNRRAAGAKRWRAKSCK